MGLLEQGGLGSQFRLCQVSLYTAVLQVSQHFVTKGKCWRMTQLALLLSRLFYICCGMLFLGYELGYAYFGQVCKEIGGIWHRRVHKTTFWNSLLRYFGLFRPVGRTRSLLARQLYAIKCISAGASTFSLWSIVFGYCSSLWCELTR